MVFSKVIAKGNILKLAMELKVGKHKLQCVPATHQKMKCYGKSALKN